MTRAAQRRTGSREAQQPQVGSYTFVDLLLGSEEAELALTAGQKRREGVLDYGGERGVSHDKTTRPAPAEAVGKKSEGIGVALEMGYVAPEDGTDHRLETAAGALGEECLYGFLAGMAERRVAHVVGQTGRSHYLAYVAYARRRQTGTPPEQLAGHIGAERHAHTGHLEAVGETVMDEDAARKRKHLGLVLKPAERRREYESVVIALELGAVVVTYGVAVLLPQPLVGNELLPIHHRY